MERHCGDLKLRLSVHKSKVMSSVDDLWELHQGEDVVGTMEQVLKFKYLGVQTSLSPSKGAAAMRKRATVCANRYRAACLRLARDGPDVVDVCTTLWRTIAMPSITFGCESVPFCESHFLELQRHQVAVGKFALGLPMSAPNVSVGALLNLQPVKAVIYKAQLKFFTRLLNQSMDRWSKDALLDHLSGKWRSPYMTYISSIKQEIGLVRGPVSRKQVEIVVDHHFSQACRKEVRRMGLSALEPLPKRGRLSFICESEASEVRVWYVGHLCVASCCAACHAVLYVVWGIMLCGLLCGASCRAALREARFCVLCCAVLCCGVLCCAVLCSGVLCFLVQCFAVVYFVELCFVLLCFVLLYCEGSCCAVLCCVVLRGGVLLCCAVMCYTVMLHSFALR